MSNKNQSTKPVVRNPKTGAVVTTSKPVTDVAPSTSTALATKPDTAVATVPTSAIAAPLTFAAFGVTVPNIPVYFAAFIAAFRAVHALPVATTAERVAVVNAFRAACERIMPNQPAPTGRHTGRFTGQPVFESQNTLYVAAVLANVPLSDAHITAAWRAELPNAKCDYVARFTYGRSTLSEYCNGRHNGCPGIPDAVKIVSSRRRVAVTGPLFDHGTAAADVKPVA